MRNVAGTFEDWLGDINRDEAMARSSLPFFVRVGCVKMSAPRHERFEFVLEMGRNDIDRVFNGTSLSSASLTFVFPERFMSVHEQQAMMSALVKHPDARSIEQVDIITSSPLLVGNFCRAQIRILTWVDDARHSGRGA